MSNCRSFSRTVSVCSACWLVCLLAGNLPAHAQPNRRASDNAKQRTLRVLSFNILQGGGDAANVGFSNRLFGGSRYDELAAVIKLSKADVVGVQEDDRSGKLLAALGRGWQREGTIYSKFALKAIRKGPWLTVCRVSIPSGNTIAVVNCHWSPKRYGPYAVQEHLRKATVPADLAKFEQEILKYSDRSSGERGYQRTLDALKPLLKARETIVVTGDFNEPSHLDWTPRAAKAGPDRWLKNPTSTPLRFAIRWKGSSLLTAAGLRDVYRVAHPDEVKHPGNTWTPIYPEKTRGRRPYSDQVVDRIDIVYVSGRGLRVRGAAVIGESRKHADIVFTGRWPSDHRAVLAVFDTVSSN